MIRSRMRSTSRSAWTELLRLLLDSRAYLWWLMDDGSLPPAARKAIAEPQSVVFVSAATIWELAIKQRLGRLEVEAAGSVAARLAGVSTSTALGLIPLVQGCGENSCRKRGPCMRSLR